MQDAVARVERCDESAARDDALHADIDEGHERDHEPRRELQHRYRRRSGCAYDEQRPERETRPDQQPASSAKRSTATTVVMTGPTGASAVAASTAAGTPTPNANRPWPT